MFKNVLRGFMLKPIAVYPVFIKITGDPHSAMAVSQILYWYGVANGEFYKTDGELSSEIYATAEQIKRIKKVLHSLSFLKITLRGVPAKTFYDVDLDALEHEINSVIETSSLGEKTQTRSGEKTQTRQGEKAQTNTENTTETTAETTSENIHIREKSEKKKAVDSKVPLYETIELPDFIDRKLWNEWQAYRIEKNGKNATQSPRAFAIHINELTELHQHGYSANECLEVLKKTGWVGVNQKLCIEKVKEKRDLFSPVSNPLPTKQNGRNRDFTTPAEYLGPDPFRTPSEKLIN